MKKKILVISIILVVLAISAGTIFLLSNKDDKDTKSVKETVKTEVLEETNREVEETKETEENQVIEETPVEEKKEEKQEVKETKKSNNNNNSNTSSNTSAPKQETKQPEQKVEQPAQKEDLTGKANAYESNTLGRYYTSQSAAQNLYNTIPSDIKSYFAVNGESIVCSVTVTEIEEGTHRKYYYGNGSYHLFAPNKTTNIDGRSMSFVDYCNEKYHLKEAESDASYTTTFYYVYKK